MGAVKSSGSLMLTELLKHEAPGRILSNADHRQFPRENGRSRRVCLMAAPYPNGEERCIACRSVKRLPAAITIDSNARLCNRRTTRYYIDLPTVFLRLLNVLPVDAVSNWISNTTANRGDLATPGMLWPSAIVTKTDREGSRRRRAV